MARMTEVGRRSMPATGRTELVSAVERRAGLTKAQAGKAVEAVIGEIAVRIAQGDRVVLRGFGTFLATRRAERTVRDFRTGERKKLAPARVVRFAASPRLKRAVNPDWEC